MLFLGRCFEGAAWGLLFARTVLLDGLSKEVGGDGSGEVEEEDDEQGFERDAERGEEQTGRDE